MNSNARVIVGLELAPMIIRGIRLGRAIRTIAQPVESGKEREALNAALKALGANIQSDSIRLVLRGMPIATTRLLNIPPEEVTSVSEYIPVPIREAAWEALPFGGDRTILLGAVRSQIEGTLDEWGITPTSSISVDAVGLTTTALLALEQDLDGEGEMLWTENAGAPGTGSHGRRALLFRRKENKFVDVGFRTNDEPAKFIVGEGAIEHARNHTGSIAFKPGGLEPAFAIACGATRWGNENFPHLPNLEPRDRREYRRKNQAARKAQRMAMAAALAMAVTAGAIQIPLLLTEQSAARAEETALTKRTLAEKEWNRLVAEIGERLPPPSGPAEDIEQILEVATRFKSELRITELRAEPATTAYAGLEPSASNKTTRVFVMTGRAVSLETIERLRTFLTNTGRSINVEDARQTERPTFPIDYRIVIR